jgi:hypothetical protein
MENSMRRSIAAWAIAAMAFAGSLGAHHSESMFEFSPLWVKGRIVELARVNPHVVVRLDETIANGSTRRWAVEGTSPLQLERRGIDIGLLSVGDAIEVCGFPMKAEFSTPRPGEPPFVHGQVLVTANGSMQMWGSYGKIRNCVRPDDGSDAWVSFLDSNERAWTAWCRRFTVSTPIREDSQMLVAEIGRLISRPCE